MASSQNLQVMSPVENTLVTTSGGVASQIPRPASSSMDISPLRPIARGNSSHSPELRVINQSLRDELGQKEEQLFQTTQAAEQVIHNQREQFRGVAQNYEAYARDLTNVEVAQSEVKVHRQMQGALNQREQQLKNEQNRLRATRTEAQTALNTQRQEIVDHAENVLQMRTDAVATEARQALQAKQSQIESIEEHALHYIHETEVPAQGQVMKKDLDLQRQTQDILILQNQSLGSKIK